MCYYWTVKVLCSSFYAHTRHACASALLIIPIHGEKKVFIFIKAFMSSMARAFKMISPRCFHRAWFSFPALCTCCDQRVKWSRTKMLKYMVGYSVMHQMGHNHSISLPLPQHTVSNCSFSFFFFFLLVPYKILASMNILSITFEKEKKKKAIN